MKRDLYEECYIFNSVNTVLQVSMNPDDYEDDDTFYPTTKRGSCLFSR